MQSWSPPHPSPFGTGPLEHVLVPYKQNPEVQSSSAAQGDPFGCGPPMHCPVCASQSPEAHSLSRKQRDPFASGVAMHWPAARSQSPEVQSLSMLHATSQTPVLVSQTPVAQSAFVEHPAPPAPVPPAPVSHVPSALGALPSGQVPADPGEHAASTKAANSETALVARRFRATMSKTLRKRRRSPAARRSKMAGPARRTNAQASGVPRTGSRRLSPARGERAALGRNPSRPYGEFPCPGGASRHVAGYEPIRLRAATRRTLGPTLRYCAAQHGALRPETTER